MKSNKLYSDLNEVIFHPDGYIEIHKLKGHNVVYKTLLNPKGQAEVENVFEIGKDHAEETEMK